MKHSEFVMIRLCNDCYVYLHSNILHTFDRSNSQPTFWTDLKCFLVNPRTFLVIRRWFYTHTCRLLQASSRTKMCCGAVLWDIRHHKTYVKIVFFRVVSLGPVRVNPDFAFVLVLLKSQVLSINHLLEQQYSLIECKTPHVEICVNHGRI